MQNFCSNKTCVRFTLIVVLCMLGFTAISQPRINSVTPEKAVIGTLMRISGSNFSTNAADNHLYFGTVKAFISGATPNELLAVLPAGAVFDRVTLTVGNRTAYSPEPIVVIAPGDPVTTASYTTRSEFTTGIQPLYIARGDFDGDGRVDMAVTNFLDDEISVFRNTSVPDAVSFAPAIPYTVGNSRTIGITTDDINTDGLLDIIVTSIDEHRFTVFRNTSTGPGTVSFAAGEHFQLGNDVWPRGIVTADMDGDGITDVITADNNMVLGMDGVNRGTFSISRNNSAGSTLSFAPPQSFSTTYEYPRNICVRDFDGDSKPDLAITSAVGKNVEVYLNDGTPGTFSFRAPISYPVTEDGDYITSGDLDGDKKPELIVSTSNARVNIFKNNSSVGNIQFSFALSVPANSVITNDIGDLNGDGKLDLVVPNVLTADLSVFVNTSTAGSISFAAPIRFACGESPMHVKIGDVDGDLRPDISVSNIASSKISVLWRSKALPLLELTPEDTTVCEGDSVTIIPNLLTGAFLWSTGETSQQITVKQSGTYWLQITTPTGILSDTAYINVAPMPTLELGNDTLFCKGLTNQLNAFHAGATYSWSNGQTAPSIRVNEAGEYSVAVDFNGCVAKDTIQIAYDSIPLFTLGPDLYLCKGQETLLDPVIRDVDFLWQDGSTAPTYRITNTGSYHLTASNGCGTTTDEIKVAEGSCALFMPTAFSPNGDGLNDFAKAITYGQLASFKLQIYDRWGTLIFSSTDINKGWDGRYQGILRDPGVFVWQCRYQLQGTEEIFQKGTITLVR